MFAQDIQTKINEYLERNSGYERQRNYLGMSQIANCPRLQYLEFMQGRSVALQNHLDCYKGHLFEMDVYQRLVAMGIVEHYGPVNDPVNPRGKELVAPFDSRFRGHTDGETVDGELLEIKSVDVMALAKLRQMGRAKYAHFLQVQAYMRYGPWAHALIVYVCRDSFEHLVLHSARSKRHGDELEAKAIGVLEAIDAKQPPKCECDRCTR